jgi:hypothetical protein
VKRPAGKLEFVAELNDTGTYRRTDSRAGFEGVFGLFVGAGMTARKPIITQMFF